MKMLTIIDKKTNIDLVLGFDSDEDYQKYCGTNIGASIGRNANRIGNAKFTLNGKDYQIIFVDTPGVQHTKSKLGEFMTDATNKATILSKEQREALIATDKLLEDNTALQVVEEVEKLGGSLMDSQGYLASTMERARASGLNMAKHSKKFADNIKLASKYNFKNGLNDLYKTNKFINTTPIIIKKKFILFFIF